MELKKIAKDAEEYARKHLYELFGNDVEIERSKTNVQT
jgi:hypothetical protein